MIKQYLKRYAKNFDYPLFFTVVLLSFFGLVMIYSSSIMVALVDGEAPDHYYKRQVLNLIISFVIFFTASVVPFKLYSEKKFMYLSLLVLMFLFTYLHIWGFGKNTVGSQSWISLFGLMNFQPSEYAKLFIILYFAAAFYRKGLKTPIRNLQPNEIIYPILIWLGIIASVGLETDLGAVGIISGIAVAVLVASGIRFKIFLKFFVVLMVCGLLLFGAILLFNGDILTENRIGRIQAFLNPFKYESGSGHQVVMGYISIGLGGLKGVGLGQSVQKLGYLPEPQTDFIMAIVAEELGLFGVIIVLGGLGFIVFRGLSIALSTKDMFARMIAAGVASWIAIQTFINVGGLAGLIPLTGVTLPFISYGGTSIIMLSLALGILVNVSMFVKLEKKKRLKEDIG